MIDISRLNAELVEQDEALRQRFADLVNVGAEAGAIVDLMKLVAEGLAAIHERQGNLITLMLQTNS